VSWKSIADASSCARAGSDGSSSMVWMGLYPTGSNWLMFQQLVAHHHMNVRIQGKYPVPLEFPAWGESFMRCRAVHRDDDPECLLSIIWSFFDPCAFHPQHTRMSVIK
jgi:hypothetical protein